MIQNFCPESMKLNKLSRQSEVRILPKSVVLPPLGGEDFVPHSTGKEFLHGLYEQFADEMSKRDAQKAEEVKKTSETPPPDGV